jgi:hypothetical protein
MKKLQLMVFQTGQRTMNRIKLFLISALILTAVFDITTTVSNTAFLAFEGNLIFLLFKNVASLFLVKIIAVSLIGFLFFNKNQSKSDLYQFFMIYMILAIIFLQIFAGFNNISVKRQIVSVINHNTNQTYTTATVPAEEIAKIAPEAKLLMSKYLQMISMNLLAPLFLALSSFILYQKMRIQDAM